MNLRSSADFRPNVRPANSVLPNTMYSAKPRKGTTITIATQNMSVRGSKRSLNIIR